MRRLHGVPVLMVIFGLLTTAIYSSVYAATGDDAFPDNANALIATGRRGSWRPADCARDGGHQLR